MINNTKTTKVSATQTTIEIVDPIDKSALATRKKECDESVVDWKDRPCKTPAEEKWWAEVFVHAQDVGKEIEEEHKRLKRPIIDDGRRIDAAFKGAQSSVAALKKLAQGKLTAAATARFEAEAEAHRLANEAGTAEEAHAALASAPEHTKLEGVRSGQRLGFNVVDIDAVPREYLKRVADGSKLTAFMKAEEAAGRMPELEGVEFFYETIVRPTGKKKKA